MSRFIFLSSVKVLKSIYRWFIMLPTCGGGEEDSEQEMASPHATPSGFGRWWMPPCIVGLSVCDQNSFHAIQLKVKWKICKLCDSFVTPSHPPPPHTVQSLYCFIFFGSHLYTAHRWFGGRICKLTAYRCANGTGNSDSWLTGQKKRKLHDNCSAWGM